jgi:transposase-like protein
MRKAEVSSGKRAGVLTEVPDKLKALEREVRELRQANEIPRKASAYFAQAPFGECEHWQAETSERIARLLSRTYSGVEATAFEKAIK